MPITSGGDGNNTRLLDGKGDAYAASATFAMPASATDVFTISGSATKLVKIRRLRFYLTATSGSNATLKIIKRTTANSGGTSATPTIVKFDTNCPAATAVARNYTANPTGLGTSAGDLINTGIYVSGGGTVGSDPFELFDFIGAIQPITLRGTAESLCINMNGVTFAGNSARVFVVWTEETEDVDAE
jgi:hypothetical protein